MTCESHPPRLGYSADFATESKDEWTAPIFNKTSTYPIIKGITKRKIRKIIIFALALPTFPSLLVVKKDLFLKEKSPLKSPLEAIA